MSTWMIVFIKRCENFAHVWADESCEVAGKVARKALYGSEALRWRYDKCFRAQPQLPEANDLKEFRMFRWMLPSEENAQVQEWQREAVQTSRARIAAGNVKALEDMEAKTTKDKKMIIPDATSSALILAPPLKEKKKAKDKSLDAEPEDEAVPEAMEREDDRSSDVLSFFGAKAV